MDTMKAVKDAEDKNIKISWWNFNTKQLDHKGTIKEFLKLKHIKVSLIKHPDKERGYTGYRAKIFVGSAIITFDSFNYDYSQLRNESQYTEGYTEFLTETIILYLTHLGDKALFETTRRDYKINWR